MSWTFTPFVLPSLLAGVIAAGVALLAWPHRNERTGRPFILFMMGLAWWAFAYAIELGHDDLAHIVLWDQIAFVGSVLVPAAFFWLAVEYAGFDDQLPSWTPAVLVIEPVVTLVLVWLYPRSRLVWEAVAVRPVGPVAFPVFDFGLWYWVNYAYSFVLVGVALVVIGTVYVHGSRIYRRQAALLIVGALIPLGANVVYNLVPAISPFPAIDLTTSAMSVTGVLYGLGLYRFRMLDIAPVARGMLLREIGDGYVVVDQDGRHVEGDEVGWRVVDLDEEYFGERGPVHEPEDLNGRMVSVPVDGTERSYEIRTKPVTDFRDERIGTLLIFRDITELEVVRQHRQRVSVMNRILRHNIRNSMTVVLGYSDLLVEGLSGEERHFAEIIRTRAERLVSLSEKARDLDTFPAVSEERQAVDLGAVVEAVVARARSDFPAASITLGRIEPARAVVSADSDISLAVDYLVENAIEHNDSAPSRVEVSVTADPDGVEVAVSDDGPGIPAHELAVLEADLETPLQHGSGLGLWIVRWIVTQSNGDIEIGENDPRGSVVTIRLPKAGSRAG